MDQKIQIISKYFIKSQWRCRSGDRADDLLVGCSISPLFDQKHLKNCWSNQRFSSHTVFTLRWWVRFPKSYCERCFWCRHSRSPQDDLLPLGRPLVPILDQLFRTTYWQNKTLIRLSCCLCVVPISKHGHANKLGWHTLAFIYNTSVLCCVTLAHVKVTLTWFSFTLRLKFQFDVGFE